MKRTGSRHGNHWRLAAVLLGVALLVIADVAAAQAAQVYKWKDEHGGIHYSDTPPPHGPAQVIKAEPAPTPTRAPAGALPYELARAVRAAPVVLYTTSNCAGCTMGRNLLRGRGIPYEERTVDSSEDAQELHRVNNGKDDLPVLLVGSRKIVGYESGAWQEALNSASYPRQKMLPAGYQFAPPVSAARQALTAKPSNPAPDV